MGGAKSDVRRGGDDREPRGGAAPLSRVLASNEHRTAAGLLALLTIVYLWPVLVGGGLLAPMAILYEVPPWTGLAPADVAAYTNIELGDVPLSLYPWQVLARELIHAGTFPAWSPHAFGGTPFFANPEVAWLSPFSLPLWILPLHAGLGVAAALKLWVAGFGTYLLSRELGLGFWPALLAGVSFALCAFNVVWLTHGVQVSVAALFPWLLWLVERLVRRGRSIDGLALAAVVAVLLLGGHPGTQLHVLTATVLYALVRAGVAGLERRELLRRLGLVGGGLMVGGLLAAVVLLPAQQAAEGTAGAFARRNGSAEFAGSRVPFDALRTMLFPDWWGRPSEGVTRGPSKYAERTFFAGAVALVLAAVALVSPGGWRRKAPFALLAAVGALVPVRALGSDELLSVLPGFDTVQNQRMLLWLLLAVAVLGGFGLQALLDAPRARRTWTVLGAAVLVTVVAIAGIDGAGGAIGDAVAHAASRSADSSNAALALASVLWWLLPVLTLAAVAGLAWRRPQARGLAGGLIVAIAALELLRFAHGFQPMASAAQAIPPRAPAIAYLQRNAGEDRIAGLELALANDYSAVYGLRDVRGYDQPQPSLRFLRLWRTIEPEQPPGTTYLFPALSRDAARLLGMLGARLAIAAPGTEATSTAFERVYDGEDATVFANRLATPRASLASRTLVAGDDDEEIAAVVAEGFDPRRDVVVRSDELGGAPPVGGRGEVHVISEDNARVTLEATAPRPAVLVLTDAWAPGWSVKVDGRPAEALQANVVQRGVLVPAGRHRVEWTYRVPGLRAGLALSALGAVAATMWLALALWSRRTARR